MTAVGVMEDPWNLDDVALEDSVEYEQVGDLMRFIFHGDNIVPVC